MWVETNTSEEVFGNRNCNCIHNNKDCQTFEEKIVAYPLIIYPHVQVLRFGHRKCGRARKALIFLEIDCGEPTNSHPISIKFCVHPRWSASLNKNLHTELFNSSGYFLQTPKTPEGSWLFHQQAILAYSSSNLA